MPVAKKAPKTRSPLRNGKATTRKTGQKVEALVREDSGVPDHMDTANMHADDSLELADAGALDGENKKLIRVNPENLGEVVHRHVMTDATRERLDNKLSR